MRDERIWVEPVGSVIVARIRGHVTAELLRECEDRVLELARETQHVRVLYDGLELEAPEMEVVLFQQQLEIAKRAHLRSASLRTALLVPNTRIAYLARIAFGHAGESNYRVFYNDLGAALKWLEDPGSAPQ
ncbi:MAG: hypothetical protein JWP65_1918 [Ramlibacter sp.]|jgi:hypothetical protein|uniref:STAS/SEC14 domain-containing protein n=1 Tax=Ramlibacter sp. TaxID=1917967 RepID=UPI0026371D53|nr:STAS/SEC14 domain-containing protein [Ramlibacter sp.]MDB5751497.1 hypothetical protein [Ramlibacter sp.]